MSLASILDEKLVQLPIKAHSEDTYYPSYVFLLLKSYEELLIRYEVAQEVIDSINIFKEQIYNVLEGYFGGDPFSAYTLFKETMEIYELESLVTNLNDEWFFRGRIDAAKKLNKHEMFHIPFELRSKVATQRFSIPGLPCLYLGASVGACRLELDNSSFDKLNVAKIKRISEEVRVLDISKTPMDIKEEYKRK